MWRKYFRDRTEAVPPDELEKVVNWSAQRKPLSPEDKIDLEYAMGLLGKAKPQCRTLLWQRYVLGWKIVELARALKTDAAALRMRINRCLDLAQGLLGN